MITKICEFCGKFIEVKIKSKRFCNDLCQRRHYYRRPEIKRKILAYTRVYQKTFEFKQRNKIRLKIYRQRPEVKEKNRILAVTRYRDKRRNFFKEYSQRPLVRAKIKARERFRLQNDKEYAIADRLRRSLNHAMAKYSKTGKIMNSKKYGLNWNAVIEHLKPFPQNIKEFEIDHIIPLHTFNLTDPLEIKKAFSPFNLQWLKKEDNRRKGGKLNGY